MENLLNDILGLFIKESDSISGLAFSMTCKTIYNKTKKTIDKKFEDEIKNHGSLHCLIKYGECEHFNKYIKKYDGTNSGLGWKFLIKLIREQNTCIHILKWVYDEGLELNKHVINESIKTEKRQNVVEWLKQIKNPKCEWILTKGPNKGNPCGKSSVEDYKRTYYNLTNLPFKVSRANCPTHASILSLKPQYNYTIAELKCMNFKQFQTSINNGEHSNPLERFEQDPAYEEVLYAIKTGSKPDLKYYIKFQHFDIYENAKDLLNYANKYGHENVIKWLEKHLF